MLKIFKRKRPVSDEVMVDIGRLKRLEEKRNMIKEASVPESDMNNSSFLANLAAASTESSEEHKELSSFDMEKFERLERRFNRIIERLELIERKIGRVESRLDIKY